MHMLRHDDISGDNETVAQPHLFQFLLEDAVSASSCKQRLPAVATEGEEVKLAGILIADQPSGHDETCYTGSMAGGDRSKVKGKNSSDLGGLPPCPTTGQDGAPTVGCYRKCKTWVGHPPK